MTDPERSAARYWRANRRVVVLLLTIWALVSFGLSIAFADQLDRVRLGGFRLGFWFAQQGSIYVYLLLIFAYSRWMNRLDRLYEVDDRSPRA